MPGHITYSISIISRTFQETFDSILKNTRLGFDLPDLQLAESTHLGAAHTPRVPLV